MIFKKYILFLSFNLILCAIQTSEFNVEGMMCGYGCVQTIEKEINSIEGIEEYNVSFEKSNMIITYDNKITDDNAIMDRLNNNTTYSCSLKKPNSFIYFFKNLF